MTLALRRPGGGSPAYSCDTLVALPDVTTTGTTILGKNSDRPVFDCQPLVYSPRRTAGPRARLRLAYLEIPDAETSYATLGSSPYWCWGYEEGLNEFGVAIGNEAIFTATCAAAVAEARAGRPPAPGLLGMELLRLGLERGRSAREALAVMTGLVEAYGQWGSGVPACGHEAGAYDNSYIIADPREAWVLETAGRRWVARRFTGGTAAISNEPSIRDAWDLASADLVGYAVEQGWWPADRRGAFDFARAYVDLARPLQVSHIRVQRSRQLLAEKAREKAVSPGWVARILRDHYEDTFLGGPYFNAALPDFLSLCMHSHPAGFTWGNTASSAIFVLPADPGRLAQLWWTPVTPCTGCYVPFFVDAGGVPETVSRAGSERRSVTPPNEARPDTPAPDSYWWRFRTLLDRVKGNETGDHYRHRQPVVRARFDELERAFAAEAETVEREAVAARRRGGTGGAARMLRDFTARCVERAAAAATELIETFGRA
ncbi:MAG TPA: C69 family dipeptidase [Thermodesulfobacteriota bacterium]